MSTLIDPAVPADILDPINARILEISEDRVQGFQNDPIAEIASRSGVDLPTVIERIQAMMRAGTIRRVRQTLLATNLARGALVAWQVPAERLQDAFDFLFQKDPFSGHVVIRSTDAATPGSSYRLWTTVKVPQGYLVEKHCEALAGWIGAEKFRVMPARGIFALGVGHVRRKHIVPGSKTEGLAVVQDVKVVDLNELEWQVLVAIKRELDPEEVSADLWRIRAAEAGISLNTFLEVGAELDRKRVIGRFSTFLEHVKPSVSGERVTRYNGLFHWAVPPGREIEAGREVGRHEILTHCYWRDAGPEFRNVNIMAVAHGLDRDLVLAHKAASDDHLESIGIPVSYTNVFWGGRSEIKPSEISPFAYRDWRHSMGLDPESLKGD
jgi:DNA-binding Lrp family transcriptional regulator